jgi:sugar lactone lactonase YvrE
MIDSRCAARQLVVRRAADLARGRMALAAKIADAPYDPAHHRFNDGRCDPQGRLLAGAMNEARDAPSAGLWRLDPDGSLTLVLGGLTIANGLAFSPDGGTMYHADTPTRTIRAFDYDPRTGTPANPRVFARFSGEDERPDGAAVDSEGCYWTALYRGGKVLRLAPSGRVLDAFPVPAMCPTMCAFGGPDLKTFTSRARGAASLRRGAARFAIGRHLRAGGRCARTV